jgi:chromosome segregation ATPase
MLVMRLMLDDGGSTAGNDSDSAEVKALKQQLESLKLELAKATQMLKAYKAKYDKALAECENGATSSCHLAASLVTNIATTSQQVDILQKKISDLVKKIESLQ